MEPMDRILLEELAKNIKLLPPAGRDFLEGVATGMAIMAGKQQPADKASA